MIEIGQAVLARGTLDETWGIAEDVTISLESEKDPVKNGEGDTVSVAYTDKRRKVSANYTPLAVAEGGTTPVNDTDLIGKAMEIKTKGTETVEFAVEGAELKLKSGEKCTWSVNGYIYEQITLTTP